MSIAPNPLNDISRVYLEQIAEKKDDSYLETDFKKRQANNEKARKEMAKVKDSTVPRWMKEEEIAESHFKVGDEVICKASGMEGEVVKVDSEEKGKYYTVKREDGKKVKYAPDELKLEDEEEDEDEKEEMKEAKNGGASKKAEAKFHKKLDTLVHKTFGKRPEEMKEAKKEKVKRWWDDDGDGIGYEEGEVSGKFKRKKKMKESFSNWRQDLSEVMDDIESDKKIKEKKVKNKVKINPKLGEAVEEIGGTLLEIVEIDEIDFVVESVYDELLSEGYEDDDIEDALEYALTEATVTYGHDTDQPYQKKTGAGRLARAVGRLARQKLASKVRGAKKSASSAVARGARKVAKGALGVARKMEGGDSKPSAAHTKTRTASTYRGAGSGTKEKVSSGSYTPPTKKKAEKPSDPWEGSATAPGKPKTKKAPVAKTKKVSAPKKKKKSKLDSLLADIRSEETQVSEGSLRPGESYMQYGKRKQAERSGSADKHMTVTAADKKANTPAYQRYVKGDERYKMVGEALRSREERMARMMTDKDRQKQKKERELKAKADEIISTERALSRGRKKNTEKTYNTPSAEVRKLKSGQKKDTLAMKARKAMEEYEIDEKMNLKTADMGDVIKDFQKSDAPQFKGRTKEERRQMAIAAKLTAERGGKKLGEQQEGSDQEIERQQMLANKKKMMQKQMMLQKQQLQMQKQGKLPLNYGEETALDRVRKSIEKEHGKGMIHDPNAPKKPRTQRKPVDSRTKREKETQGRYLGGGRYAGD